MSKIDVSVVVPVYNTGKTAKVLIRKLLDSYDRIELIIVDDGSTDGSAELLDSINNVKVRVFHKENAGPSSARNFGLKKAKGKYLMFIDSDDDIKKHFIREMVLMMDESTAMVVSGVEYNKLSSNEKSDVYLDPFDYKQDETNKDLMLRSLLYDGRMYPAFNKIFRTETIKNHDVRYDETMNYGEDTKFVMDYLNVAEGKIKFILKPLYIYYAGTSTSTAKKSQGVWSNWQKCFDNLKHWVGKNPSWNQKRILALIYLKWRASWLRTKI